MPAVRPNSSASSAPRGSANQRVAVDRSVDITIRAIDVDGHTVRYSTGGTGPVVLFLHGWGLGHHAYRPGLRRLAQSGVRVVAPAMPGFGGTNDLKQEHRSFAGYAAWVRRFANAMGLTDLTVVGHSFGGGVATQFCLEHRDIARRVVLLNAVGAPWRGDTRKGAQAMADRPLWNWGVSIPSDVVALLGRAGAVMPSVLEDLVPNVVRNPFGISKVGTLARKADLRAELSTLRALGFPMTVVHSERDAVIPKSSFACMCEVAGVEGISVPGNHSWPLTEPAAFAATIGSAMGRRHIVAA